MQSIISCGLLSVLFGLGFTGQADTIYVSTHSQSSGPGTAWSNAFQTIQGAIDAASAGDTVLVTNGVYSAGTAAISNSLCRVALTNAITLQSVNGPEHTFICGADDPVTPNGSNSVRCAYLVDGAFMTGFTLTNGYAQMDSELDSVYCTGGGVYFDQGGMVSNCIIRNASSFAGAVSCSSGGTAKNCTIRNNLASMGSGLILFGGGTASHCTISNNTSVIMAGGAYLVGGTLEYSTIVNNQGEEGSGIYCGNATVRACTVAGNSGDLAAGIYSENSSVLNCIVSGNQADNAGGGLVAYASSVENCTLVANSAGNSVGGAYCDTNSTVKNTILYYNTAPEDPNWSSFDEGVELSYTYCNTTPQPAGTGCFSTPPQFIDQANGNLRLRYDSPCIDTGTTLAGNTNDILGEARPIDGDQNSSALFDVGAYEYNPETVDSDGDGRTDAVEISMGYHPGFNEDVVIQTLLTDIQNNPSSYGLYTSNSIGDLNMGHMMVQTGSNTVQLSLQLEQCTNLTEGVWTNAGNAVDWNLPAENGKAFYRVRAQ